MPARYEVVGADEVIDYTKEEFLDRPETYDVVIDVLGKSRFSRCRRILRPRGRLVFVSFKMKQILQMLRTSVLGGKRVICALVAERREDLVFAGELMEAGKIQTIVDRTFPLEQAADAHRYAESGAKKGYRLFLPRRRPVDAERGFQRRERENRGIEPLTYR
jgi:NADPH:quinone reductase-like Zn-dependent oxidoreductase